MHKLNFYQQTSILISIALLLHLLVSGCSLKEKRSKTKKYADTKLQKADSKTKKRFPLQNKQLVVLLNNSPYSYAIVDGTPVGLEYELLNLFAQDNGLDLQIKVIAGKNHLLDSLQAGIGDIAVARLHSNNEYISNVNYTLPLLTTDLRLIQRNPSQRVSHQPSSVSSFIKKITNLNAKRIAINSYPSVKDSLLAYAKKHRLTFIFEEKGENQSQEELVGNVSNGKLDYAVVDGNVAEAMGTYHSNIDYKTLLADSIQINWAVNTHSAGMLESLNDWIVKRKGTLEYNMIINKYTKLSVSEKKAVRNQYATAKESAISPYDKLLKSYAAEWDWRLLAALVYQESRFDPEARSGAGAVGLMQVLPATAKWLGNQPNMLKSPEKNIQAGMEYLHWLKDKWQETISDEEELIKFTLASYNVGFGHVRDAYHLAKKYNLDPQKWEGNVEQMLLAKSEAKFYQDSAVEFGYCRGKEPVQYVQNILYYYQHYQNVL